MTISALDFGFRQGDLALSAVVLTGALFIGGVLLRQGYARRRPHWTVKSWQRFAIILGGGVAVLGVSLGMSIAVDHGVYAGMSDRNAQHYLYTLIILVHLGAGAIATTLLWFAYGPPARQLDWPRASMSSGPSGRP